MTVLSILHKFISAKGDGPDTTRVKPTNWNSEHDITVDGDGVVLGRPAGAGPGPIQAVDPSAFFPPGMVVDFAGSVAPTGWYMLYGQLVSRTGDPALFAAIGTTYGAGDGVTTFRLPDARGAATAGKSDMGGADRGNLPGGTVLGAYMGATGVGGLPVSVSVSGGCSVSGGLSGVVHANATAGSGSGAGPMAGDNAPVNVSGSMSGSFSGSGSGGTTAGFNIIQPTLVFNKIIKR